MKIALGIHLFMLALAGGLAWHAGGSPFLLTASMVVVLVIAMLGIRPGLVAEIGRLVTSAVLISLCPLYYENDPNLSWLCLLTLPQLWAATQCVWEIRFAGTSREAYSIKIRESIFTLGFYATLGLAFLLLHADVLNIDRATGIMLAVVISLSGLTAWETARVGHLKKGLTIHTLSGRGFAFRAAIMVVGAAIFALLFTVVLPLAANALCDFSPNLKSQRDPPESGADQLSDAQSGESDETQSDDESDSDAGSDVKSRVGPSRLPMRGTLELSEEIRVVIKLEDYAQAETLIQQGPLYVRTLAVSKFKDGRWVRDNPSVHRIKDAADGQLDGRVEVSKPMPGEISHEVFLPQSTGYALPALAGVTTYALPEILARPDNWFQTVATGDIRYKAWSKPVNILTLSNSKLEPGMPGEAYMSRIPAPFGDRLTEAAESFMSQRADLTGRLKLLHHYFQSEFKYSRTVENKSGLPPLENFLFDEKKGYCDFFASSAALILRHMGIPSRVAYGYKDGEHDADTDTWIFREFHSHAWTEIYVQDHGWIICDFTPPASDSLQRSGTLSPSDMAKFKALLKSCTDGEHKLRNKTQSLQSIRSLWVPAILGLGLLVAIVSFLLRMRHAPMHRAAKINARKRAKRDSQPDYFIEFLDMCKTLGHARLKGQTLMEFHRQLKRSKFCDDHFDDLTAYYYKSRYEDAPRDESSEHGFLKRIREFRKSKSRKTKSP